MKNPPSRTPVGSMKRITPRDWEIINAALALYQADDPAQDDETLAARIAAVREKVHERFEIDRLEES